MQELLIKRLLDYAVDKYPCCHFEEFDDLIVSGKVTSASGHYVKNMSVVVATVYRIDQPISDNDLEDYKNSNRDPIMFFKVWCNANDPQLPKDGDTKLWFDFSDHDTEVAVVVKHIVKTPELEQTMEESIEVIPIEVEAIFKPTEMDLLLKRINEVESPGLITHAREWISDGWDLDQQIMPEQIAAAIFMEATTQDEYVKEGTSVESYPKHLRRIAYQILKTAGHY